MTTPRDSRDARPATPRGRHALVVWLTLLLAWALHAPQLALGDDTTPATAELLFREGEALFEEQRYAEACPKLESAVELAGPTALGGKLLLAECFAKLGRTASAWGLFAEVRAKSTADPERARTAQASQDALFPLLHYVVLEAPAEVRALEGLVVRKGTTTLPVDVIGSRLPADPGRLVFRLEAADHEPSETVVEVPATAGVTKVSLVMLQRVGAPLPPKPREPEPEVAETFWGPGKVAGVVLGAVGLAALGGGVVVGALASAQYDTALVDGDCTASSPPVCRDTSPVEDALRVADVGTGLVIGGSLVAVTGVLFVLLMPGAADAPVALDVGPRGGAIRARF